MMSPRQNKRFSYMMVIIFVVVAISQAIAKNFLAIVPFVCAVISFVKGFRINDQ